MINGKDLTYKFGSGFVIGLGLIIPGVSGAVLAMILGVYQPIIAAVAKPFTNWRQNLELLAPLGVGAVVCLFLFSRLLEFLFAQYPLPTLYLFFGLVLGSLPTLVALANTGGFRLSYIPSLCLGLALLFFTTNLPSLLSGGGVAGGGLFTYLFLGALVGVGLIVPGLSASFLLMAFGFYEVLLRAVNQVDFAVLIPVALGLVPTLILVSRGITWLFRQAHGHTSYLILGLLVGSLLVAFPGWPRTALELVIAFPLFFVGLWISTQFSHRTHAIKGGD